MSDLHYTHHMRAFLLYYNINNEVGSSALILIGLNCFVHIFMYYYFAFPYSFMSKFKINYTNSISSTFYCIINVHLYYKFK